MRLKKFYSAREVASLTGLSARQLQWWDAHRLFKAAVAPRRTKAGGFRGPRATPPGLPASSPRRPPDPLRQHFGVRLYEVIGHDGPVTLLTNGRDVYARTAGGEFYNLLENPRQPLLEIGGEGSLRELTARARRKKSRKKAVAPAG